MNASRLGWAVVILAAILGNSYSADTPEPTILKGHTHAVTVVTWSADGKTIASAGNDRSIRIWNPISGQLITTQSSIAREGYGGPVVAFTADLKLAAVNYWGEITIRTVADGKAQLKIDPILDRGQKSAFRPDVFAMAFCPDGKRLATAGSVAAVGGPHGLPGGVACVWDVETGKIIHQTEKLSTAASSITWSKDGKRFAVGTNGAGGELPEPGEVKVWDAENCRLLHTFKVKPKVAQGEWASAGDVEFDPSSQRIAAPVTAGSRGAPAGIIIDDIGASVRVWDLSNGQSHLLVKGLKAAVGRVVFSPDSKQLATAGHDKVVRLWELKSGKELVHFTCPDQVTAIAFSPDGSSLAVGCKDGSLRIWSIAIMKPM